MSGKQHYKHYEALVQYLQKTRDYYYLFEKDASPQLKIKKCDELLEYFAKEREYPEKWLTSETVQFIQISLTNLKWLLESGLIESKTSHLTTNVVENFFSCVCSKILYPTFFDYCINHALKPGLVSYFISRNLERSLTYQGNWLQQRAI